MSSVPGLRIGLSLDSGGIDCNDCSDSCNMIDSLVVDSVVDSVCEILMHSLLLAAGCRIAHSVENFFDLIVVLCMHFVDSLGCVDSAIPSMILP